MVNNSPWTIADSIKTYGLQGWGEPYFSINDGGHVCVDPQGLGHQSIDLFDLIQSLHQRNIRAPLVIRFSDILRDRLQRLNDCFNHAIERYDYPNQYRGVYPIKCNQHRHLVETLVKEGQQFQFGLEAGSKAELMIALAMAETGDRPNNQAPLLICNGYKDRSYIETALLATRLGHRPIIVLEQWEELELTLTVSKALGIEPVLGVRAKLNANSVGHWQNTSGDRAKFGLTVPQILKVVDTLKAEEQLHTLQLLHFHIGSQISAIRTIKDAMREACQIYGELAQMGADMNYLDVGGGLAVDYDGSKTNSHASKNYNMQNYANDIVAEMKEAAAERNIPAPTIISESGRAIVSHHCVLVFEAVATSQIVNELPPHNPEESSHLLIKNLWETYHQLDRDNYQESFNDAIQFKQEAISLFNFGYLSLRERATAEQLYWACCEKILPLLSEEDYIPDELKDLDKNMAAIYYINLSIFRSLPDTWAIDQLFPVMPLQRLNTAPTERGILADITCDSDGKLDRFIDLVEDDKSTLELHPLQPGEPYYLGMFLVGAYQEIMGSLHNLFGDTNVVHVSCHGEHHYHIDHVIKGDTTAEVLSYVEYDGKHLLETLRKSTERSLRLGHITLQESQKLLENYESGLNNYTYLG